MGSHIVDGKFQSDKYPTCPPDKVPLSVGDPSAQDLLWEYARRRRAVDAEFSDDLEAILTARGYAPGPESESDELPGTREDWRALMSDGRRLDEAMTSAPWRRHGLSIVGDCLDEDGSVEIADMLGVAMEADGEGVPWMRNNLRSLLEICEASLVEQPPSIVEQPPSIVEQPSPILTERIPTWEIVMSHVTQLLSHVTQLLDWPEELIGLVLTDMQARSVVGRARYGTPLTPGNGRDHLVDAYQECLDAVVYLANELGEHGIGLDGEDLCERAWTDWSKRKYLFDVWRLYSTQIKTAVQLRSLIKERLDWDTDVPCPICPGCKREIDPDTCHCGTAVSDHNQGSGHSPVSMGCSCHEGSTP